VPMVNVPGGMMANSGQSSQSLIPANRELPSCAQAEPAKANSTNVNDNSSGEALKVMDEF